MDDLINFNIKFGDFNIETNPEENDTIDGEVASISNNEENFENVLLNISANVIGSNNKISNIEDNNITLLGDVDNGAEVENSDKITDKNEEEVMRIKDAEFYSGGSSSDSEVEGVVKDAEVLSDDHADNSDSTISAVKLKGVEGYEWKLCEDGDFPDDAVEGGNNIDGKIYVARIHHNGSILIGKLLPNHRRAYSYLNEQIQSKEYEVLCDKDVKWVKFKTSYTYPNNVIFGGYDIVNNCYYYIGRARHGNSITVGKVDVSKKICYVLYGQKENKFYEYELLISTNSTERKKIGEITKLPPTDLATIQARFALKELSNITREYTEIKKTMNSSIKSHIGLDDIKKYKIISIVKVYNSDLLEAFNSKKNTLEETNIMQLFHGSKNCKEIAENGFHFNSADTTALFGQGLYFAKSSSKSNQYSPCTVHNNKNCTQCVRSMLYCRVILGKTLELKTENKQYSPSNPPKGYDSITGIPSAHCLRYHEYVIYDKNQVYPDYIINYKVIRKS